MPEASFHSSSGSGSIPGLNLNRLSQGDDYDEAGELERTQSLSARSSSMSQRGKASWVMRKTALGSRAVGRARRHRRHHVGEQQWRSRARIIGAIDAVVVNKQHNNNLNHIVIFHLYINEHIDNHVVVVFINIEDGID